METQYTLTVTGNKNNITTLMSVWEILDDRFLDGDIEEYAGDILFVLQCLFEYDNDKKVSGWPHKVDDFLETAIQAMLNISVGKWRETNDEEAPNKAMEELLAQGDATLVDRGSAAP